MKTLPQRKNMKNFKNMKNIGRGREVGGKFHDKAYPRGNPSSTGWSCWSGPKPCTIPDPDRLPLLLPIGVPGGGAAAPPALNNFSAHSVFRASASCPKILNDKKYLNTVKIFRVTLFFRASASCSKMLNNKKYLFSAVKLGHPLFFRASASYSNILNVKSIFNTVKKSRATLFFRASASCSKIRNVKSIFNTVKIFRATLFFSGQAQVAQKSWM